jgi:hypothetical protein
LRKRILRPHCEDRLGQTKTASIVDGMGLGRIFELGIGIGCDHNNLSSKENMTTDKMDAALDAIIEVNNSVVFNFLWVDFLSLFLIFRTLIFKFFSRYL